MAVERRLATASAPTAAPDVDYDVVKDFATLRRETLRRCRVAASSGDADAILSAYMAAAGLNQIIEDYLHREVLRRVGARLGGRAATLAMRAGATLGRWRAATRDRRLVGWQRQLQTLVDELGSSVLFGSEPPATTVTLEADRILKPAWSFPAALRGGVVRVPVCFPAFDERREDYRTLAAAFADRCPERGRPVAVIGIRTSGSYLAPLCAADLRALGFQGVEVLTWRKGQRWLPEEGRRLATVLSADGLALLVEDPPISGGTLHAAAEELGRIGFPTDSIVPW